MRAGIAGRGFELERLRGQDFGQLYAHRGAPITPGSGATTPILLTLTDDTTSDGMVSFYANISQVQITPRSGSDATLYSSTSTLEMMHSAGSTQYLTMTGLSQNSYKNIIVTITDPLITYIDSTGATVTEEFPNYSGSAGPTFHPW